MNKVVLNEINQNVRKDPSSVESIETLKTKEHMSHPEKSKLPYLDWRTLYEESEVKGHYKIKPKHQNESENSTPDAWYDVYIFNADLTDINTDGLVNAASPNLHPGYVGDGIARRIREKAGKQMQDACKKIIRQEHNNESIHEGEVISFKLNTIYLIRVTTGLHLTNFHIGCSN